MPEKQSQETKTEAENKKPSVSKQQEKQQEKQQQERPKAPSEVASEKAAATQLPVAVAARAPVPVMPGNLEGLWKLSDALARAKILPPHLTDNNRADHPTIKANVFWVLQCGAELGIPPTQAIMGIAVINGKPCVYGDLLIGKVRASGLVDYIKEWSEGEGDDLVAYCEARRSDTGEVILRSFSWADAAKVVQKSQRFGDKRLIDKDTYQNYGPRMIQLRCRSYCLRDGFSDILKGIRVAEEEEDQAFVGPAHVLEAAPRPEPPKTTIPIEVLEAPPMPAKPIEGEVVREPTDYEQTANHLISTLEAVVNVEDFDSLWEDSAPIYDDLPGALRQLVTDRYDEIRNGLSQASKAAR